MVTVGVDIGGTNLRIGLVDKKGAVRAFRKTRQEKVLSGDHAVENLIEYLLKFLSDNAGEEKVSAACLGMPATLDAARETVLNAPNVLGLNGINLQRELNGRFSFPIFLCRDVEALFLFDLHRFSVGQNGTAIACYIGTGLGNAVAVDGKLLAGTHGVAGELGHIPAWDSDVPCSCGNRGCVEELVGGKALERLQKTRFPETPVGELFSRHKKDPELLSYVGHLALPIAAEINILDPGVAVLGGGVLSMASFPLDLLRKEILRHVRKPLPYEQLKFIFSPADGKNGVAGAGLLAWKLLRREAV